MDSTIPVHLKSEILSFQPASVATQASLCGTCSETLKTSFLALQLNYMSTKLELYLTCVLGIHVLVFGTLDKDQRKLPFTATEGG